MAQFKVNATIFVDCPRIVSKNDVIDEIQSMLDSYFYDNESDLADIVIRHNSVNKMKKKDFNYEAYGL